MKVPVHVGSNDITDASIYHGSCMWMESGEIMIIEMTIVAMMFFIVGFILGMKLGKSDGPQIKVPEWLNSLRSILGI